MKRMIGRILSYFWIFLHHISSRRINVVVSELWMSRFKVEKGNQVAIRGGRLEYFYLNVCGCDNILDIRCEHLTKTIVTVCGNGNKIIFDGDVGMSNGNVIVRGDGCVVHIGKSSTFGGIRIVNVGKNNDVKIGEGCLFSDGVELWASDTHPIYDGSGGYCNPEQPVRVGANVWVGANVSILKGVTVGDGAIIGMGSIVTKDVPNRCIVAGVPAVVVRQSVSWSLYYPSEPKNGLK